MINTILAQADPSWVPNMTGNLTRYLFYSYGEIIGLDIFFTIFFGVIGGYIFVQSNHNLSATIGYFLLVQTFMAAVMTSTFTIMMWIIVSLMAAGYAYNTYFRKRD